MAKTVVDKAIGNGLWSGVMANYCARLNIGNGLCSWQTAVLDKTLKTVSNGIWSKSCWLAAVDSRCKCSQFPKEFFSTQFLIFQGHPKTMDRERQRQRQRQRQRGRKRGLRKEVDE